MGFDKVDKEKKGIKSLVKGNWYLFSTDRSCIAGKLYGISEGEIILSESVRNVYNDKGMLQKFSGEAILMRDIITEVTPTTEEETRAFLQITPPERIFLDKLVEVVKEVPYYGILSNTSPSSIFLSPFFNFKRINKDGKYVSSLFENPEGALIYKPFSAIIPRTKENLDEIVAFQNYKLSQEKK